MQLTPTYVILVPKNKLYVYNVSQYAPCIIAVKNNAKYLKSKKSLMHLKKRCKPLAHTHTPLHSLQDCYCLLKHYLNR